MSFTTVYLIVLASVFVIDSLIKTCIMLYNTIDDSDDEYEEDLPEYVQRMYS